MTSAENEAIQLLDSIEAELAGETHANADKVILAFLAEVHPEVAAAYERVQDRIYGWYFE